MKSGIQIFSLTFYHLVQPLRADKCLTKDFAATEGKMAHVPFSSKTPNAATTGRCLVFLGYGKDVVTPSCFLSWKHPRHRGLQEKG
ncbi:hypothetical protein IWZ00DRAFT_507820 [Phyllosticta capitalensis]